MNKPVLLTRGIVVFPGSILDIEIGRLKSINSINLASEGDKKVIVVCQKDPQIEDPKFDDIYQVGTLCDITFLQKNDDNSYKVSVKGTKRVHISKLTETKNALEADFEILKEANTNTKDIGDKIRLLYDMIEKTITNLSQKESKALKSLFLGTPSPSKVADQVAAVLPVDQEKKQALLQETDVVKRIDLIIRSTSRDEDAKTIDSEITRKVNSSLSKQQKEFYLREKMRVVKEELGEINSKENDTNSFKKRVEENPYPEHIKKRVLSELNRMEASNPQENSITRAYIE
jgi:ATP-dependent Lon protease